MILINHRINSTEQLSEVPLENGAEIDVRYHENDLILEHDPFRHHLKKNTLLRDFLKHWKNDGPLILNVKTEGIELECIKLMNEFKIEKWLFLDLSMPFFAIYAEKAIQGEIEGFSPDNLAVRYSEREPIEYAISFQGKAKWVWVDCFTFLPLNGEIINILKKFEFKICIVSPELQHHDKSRIEEFKLKLKGNCVDAICTKFPNLWVKSDV